jgi:hypothetical protein
MKLQVAHYLWHLSMHLRGGYNEHLAVEHEMRSTAGEEWHGQYQKWFERDLLTSSPQTFRFLAIDPLSTQLSTIKSKLS